MTESYFLPSKQSQSSSCDQKVIKQSQVQEREFKKSTQFHSRIHREIYIKMKFTCSCLVVLFLFVAAIECQNVQQWGQLSPGSDLFHKENIIWHNASPDGQQMRRPFHFPRFVEDERFFPKIGAVIVTHQRGCPNTNAELSFGGPWHRYVGLEFESAPSECIYSIVEIYS